MKPDQKPEKPAAHDYARNGPPLWIILLIGSLALWAVLPLLHATLDAMAGR